MDEAIAQMVAFTDTTPDRAAQYLQVTDGDVEQAVSLFFESGGVDLGGPTTTATQPSALAGSGDASNPINLDDDNLDNHGPVATTSRSVAPAAVDDDEAMARRLQEEMYGAGGEEHTVRAPLARQTETLVGPGASEYYGGSSLDEAIEERMQSFQSRRGKTISPYPCL